MKALFFSACCFGSAFTGGFVLARGFESPALFFALVAIFMLYCALDAAQEELAEAVRKTLDPLAVAHDEEARIHG